MHSADITTYLGGRKIIRSVVRKIELEEPYGLDSQMQISIGSNDWKGIMVTISSVSNGKKKEEQVTATKSYDVAYVGRPEFSLKDLFSSGKKMDSYW